MTLHELFDYLSVRPLVTLACFAFPVAVAAFAYVLGRGRGYLQPWRTLYSVLIYAVCIPGILAATLCAYLFLFERQSVWDLNLLTTLVPIVSMSVTLWLIQRNVDLAYVPGFHRLSGLIALIFVLIFVMWVADRLRLIMFSYLPAAWLAVIFLGLVLLVQWGLGRVRRAV